MSSVIGFFKVSPVYPRVPVDAFRAGIDETMQIRAELADALKDIECAHGVDIEVLPIIKGSLKGGCQMIDGIDSRNSLADIVGIAQIAEERFHAVVGIQFAGAAGVGGVNEAADGMPLASSKRTTRFAPIRAGARR